MSFEISMQRQLDAFNREGMILSPDGNINEEGFWNFNKWHCDQGSLEAKAKEMMKLAAKFAVSHPELNTERHYVYFSNEDSVEESSFDELHIADEKRCKWCLRKNLSY